MAMKLKFIDQQYQTDAVNSIVDIFDGCEQRESLFTIDLTQDKLYNKASSLEGKGVSYELGFANKCTLSDYELSIMKLSDSYMEVHYGSLLLLPVESFPQ